MNQNNLKKIESVISGDRNLVDLEWEPPADIMLDLRYDTAHWLGGSYSDCWRFQIRISMYDMNFCLGGNWYHGLLTFGKY